MAEITVQADAFVNADEDWGPRAIGTTLISAVVDSAEATHIVFEMPTFEKKWSMKASDLRKALRALDEE